MQARRLATAQKVPAPVQAVIDAIQHTATSHPHAQEEKLRTSSQLGLVSEFQTGNSSIDTKSEGRLEKGIAQTPTNKNYALELLTFETIVGVSSPGVQWTGLTLGEPPS